MNDIVVVGAGIVGLATARAIQQKHPGIRVTLLDKADDIGTAQTGHNSGVIHAGLYYSSGSLKARLCRAGEVETKEFADSHGIPYASIGKLVVATTPLEVSRLEDLETRAHQNGIAVKRIDHSELRTREPNIVGEAALLSPATGVIDYRKVADALARDVQEADGRIILRSEVRKIVELKGARPRVQVEADSGTYRARVLVACAGLQADRVAKMGGLDPEFRIVPFRGEYYQLPASLADIVSHLIYPVPDPDLPFLGVHLSPTIDGRITVGPNAVLGFARESYPKWSFNLRDTLSTVLYRGMWKFAPGYLRPGLAEMRDSLFTGGYLKQVRKYCPRLEKTDLRPYPAGIRAQAIGRNGSSIEDFLFLRSTRQVHVGNAPSPAATSALPIGRLIAEEVSALLD